MKIESEGDLLLQQLSCPDCTVADHLKWDQQLLIADGRDSNLQNSADHSSQDLYAVIYHPTEENPLSNSVSFPIKQMKDRYEISKQVHRT